MCFAKEAFLKANFSRVEWTEWAPGRIGALTCTGAKGSANFVNAHFFPSSDAARKQYIETIHNKLQDESCNILTGDFNFVPKSDDRMYYDSDEPTSNIDEHIQDFWDTHFSNYSDISQTTSMTQFSPEHCARLDRVYIQAHLVPSQFITVHGSVVPGFRDLSDHVPITTNIYAKTNTQKKRIPKHIVKHPLFKTHVEELWAKYNSSESNPWGALTELKRCFWEACKYVRKEGQNKEETMEDDLATAASFFRAVVGEKSVEIQTCLKQLPRLNGCYTRVSVKYQLTSKFFELWNELSLREEREMQEQTGTRINDKSGGVAKEVGKHQNASSQPLDAIWDATQNKPVTSREEKVKLLNKHWEEVLSPKPFSRHAFEKIIRNYSQLDYGDSWEISESYLEKLLDKPKQSSPGPDGIPFSAFSCVKSISKQVFWACASDLLQGGAPPQEFNHALLVLLAKKPSVSADGANWFAPKDTRPISIVNSDNRILANMFRDVLARFADKRCCKQQRGFLLNRFLLENVVDADFESRKVYLSDKNGALILVDLAAAFPSLGHDFLFEVLTRQGIPDNLVHAIKQFYIHNNHFTCLDGETTASFIARSGVRQGCPMSPVLFALALDPFLEYLVAQLPSSAMVRAYADDMAIVVDQADQVNNAADAFKLLSEAASLQVNVGKTVFIPLYATVKEQAQKDVSGCSWRGMETELHSGKYLGFYVGPGADAAKNFRCAFAKFKSRAQYWLTLNKLGNFFQCVGFDMCCLSTLSFIAQLYRLPDHMLKEAMDLASRFMHGPAQWLNGVGGHAYFRSKVDLNMKAVPRCPRAMLTASGIRAGQRFISDHAEKLIKLKRAAGEGSSTLQKVRDVLEQSPFNQFKSSQAELQGCKAVSIPSNNVNMKGRLCTYQSLIYDSLFDSFHPPGAVHHRFDRVFRKRWCVPNMLDNLRAARLSELAVKHLKWLGTRVPPRVHSASIRLHCNGWHTARRYQQQKPCVFCKSEEDSIEHILHCSTIQHMLPPEFKVGVPGRVPMKSFFLFELDGRQRILMSLFVFGIYTLHNQIRHSNETRELRHSLYRIISDVPLHKSIRQAWIDLDLAYNEYWSSRTRKMPPPA